MFAPEEERVEGKKDAYGVEEYKRKVGRVRKLIVKDHCSYLLSHVKEGPKHEELPVKENQKFAIFERFICFFRITSILLAKLFIVAIGNEVNKVHDKG